MTAKVYAHSGAEAGSIELDENVFGSRVSTASIHSAIRQELANRRVGTAATKGRGEVHGSNKKPWRQKGTGRARAGQKRSPIWVGGGTIFGPQPHSFEMRMPRKGKRVAMRSVLSLKAKQNRIRVIEDVKVDSGKTKDLVRILAAHGAPERTVMIVGGDNAMVRRAGRNIPWLQILSYKRLMAHSLFYGRRILLEASAAKSLAGFYQSSRTREGSEKGAGDEARG
jgi:large subunit ribosomal protein L4